MAGEAGEDCEACATATELDLPGSAPKELAPICSGAPAAHVEIKASILNLQEGCNVFFGICKEIWLQIG